MAEKKEFYDTTEAAAFLNVSVITLRTYIRKGLIKANKSRSGKVYFQYEDLREFITR